MARSRQNTCYPNKRVCLFSLQNVLGGGMERCFEHVTVDYDDGGKLFACESSYAKFNSGVIVSSIGTISNAVMFVSFI